MRGSKTEVRPGVWKLRVYVGRGPNGSPIQEHDTVHGGVRAADKRLAAMVAKAAKSHMVKDNVTVAELVKRYIDHCESIGRAATTVRKYRQIASKSVDSTIGDLRVAKLSASDLDKLYASLTSKGNKPTTVRRVHALIGASLRQGEKWDLVDRNVSTRATPPKVYPADVEVPTPEEVQSIISEAEKTHPLVATITIIAALTGARRGELCALRWTDIDWRGRTLNIDRAVYEPKGGGWALKDTKSHQGRKIGVDDYGIETLKSHRAGVDALADELGLKVADDAFIFSTSPQGLEPVRPEWLSKVYVRLASKTGVKTHLHALRHFSATQAIAAGFDAVTVANRLGHADASITLRVYSSAIQQRDVDLAASLGQTLRRSA
jgi:integrase